MKAILFLFALTGCALAQEPTPAEAQLREQLRATALQLRAAETEKANALATFAAAEAKNEALQKEVDELNARLATLTKRSSEDKAASEAAIASLADKVTALEQRLKEYAAALDKWKASHQTAASLAREKENERAGLATENAVLRNTIADRERKNINLYNLSLEVLDRYENYALGKALSAREPFVQKTRVTIESQVEGYLDTVIDNRIKAK